MKNLFCTVGLAIALVLPARGQTVPTYTTLTASGTTTATVAFATSPLQQVRIVSAFATSDLAASTIKFWTGATPLTITASNAIGTTVVVASTNGFTVGDMVMLETAAGARTNSTIASFTGSTNITFAQNVFAMVPGDQIYDCGQSPVTLKVGSGSVTYTGDMIYVGNRGRPVLVRVNGTSACSLDAITAKCE